MTDLREVRRRLPFRACTPDGAYCRDTYEHLDLVWFASSPLRVEVRLRWNHRASWPLLRSMLADAATEALGDGAVRVEPVGRKTMLTLDGHGRYATPRSGIDRFLASTERIVAVGDETVDVDGFLARLGLVDTAGGDGS